MDDNEEKQSSLEVLLSKYIAIWIWSILFGALSGLTYSFLGGYYQIGNWGSLSFLLVIEFSIGILASLGAWQYMFQYLISYIIPRFIHKDLGKENDEEIKTEAAFSLRQVFLMMILALSMRFALELSMLILSILQF